MTIPLEPFIYGIGDIDIRTTLCPGGKKRLGALMNLVKAGRLKALGVTSTQRTPTSISRAAARQPRPNGESPNDSRNSSGTSLKSNALICVESIMRIA